MCVSSSCWLTKRPFSQLPSLTHTQTSRFFLSLSQWLTGICGDWTCPKLYTQDRSPGPRWPPGLHLCVALAFASICLIRGRGTNVNKCCQMWKDHYPTWFRLVLVHTATDGARIVPRAWIRQTDGERRVGYGNTRDTPMEVKVRLEWHACCSGVYSTSSVASFFGVE